LISAWIYYLESWKAGRLGTGSFGVEVMVVWFRTLLNGLEEGRRR
jgi:hypothetical protein